MVLIQPIDVDWKAAKRYLELLLDEMRSSRGEILQHIASMNPQWMNIGWEYVGDHSRTQLVNLQGQFSLTSRIQVQKIHLYMVISNN